MTRYNFCIAALVFVFGTLDGHFLSSAVGQELLYPIRYDLPNGHTGAYTYYDGAYTGVGNKNQSGAPLTDGTGDLTDGVFATKWDWGSQADANPWVGWDSFSPTITYTFGSPVGIDGIRLHTLANHQARIHIWESVNVVLDGGEALHFTFNDALYADRSLHTLELPISRYATTIEMQLSPVAGKWGFLSETEFTAVPEPTGNALLTGMLALTMAGGFCFRRSVRR
jgi:hypothetical protein